MITVSQKRAVGVGHGRIAEAVQLLLCCLLFVGLLARGLIPVGYMPERNADNGDLVVAMCSGAGEMQTMHLDPSEAPSKGKTAGQHCPFASLSAPVIPEPGASVDAPVTIIHVQLPYSPRNSAHTHAVWFASAPPTGPPPTA